MEDIEQRITAQADVVRSLKAEKAPKEQITAEVVTLNALKAERDALAPKDATVPDVKAKEPKKKAEEDKKGKGVFTLKNAKVRTL